MSIIRHEIRKISDENRGQPVISQAVVHGNAAYFAGITPNPIVGDIKTQTAQVLRRVDELLTLAGTDKSQLLSAQVWIADMRLFEDHILFGTSGSIRQTLQRGLVSRPTFGDLGCSLKLWWLRPCHEPLQSEKADPVDALAVIDVTEWLPAPGLLIRRGLRSRRIKKCAASAG